jgi:hypothetical protein
MTVDPSAVSGESASVERFGVDGDAGAVTDADGETAAEADGSSQSQGQDAPDIVDISYRWPTAAAAVAAWPEGWGQRGDGR